MTSMQRRGLEPLHPAFSARALPTELTDAPSLQEEYQPQNTYSEIIVHERVSDSDGLFGI